MTNNKEAVVTDVAKTLKTDPILAVGTRVVYTERPVQPAAALGMPQTLSEFLGGTPIADEPGTVTGHDFTMDDATGEQWIGPYDILLDSGETVEGADYNELVLL